MPTNYPTSLDSLTNPSSTDKENSASVPHAAQHANSNDAIEALQAKLGVDSSSDTSSIDYFLKHASGAFEQHNHSNNGAQIVTAGIEDDSITTDKIVDDAITDDKVENGAYVPVGGIIIWSGAVEDIPTNWQICDGTNGTPNLTDRFVIHADADSGGTNDVGDTGGASTHTHGDGSYSVNSHSHGRGSLQALLEYNIAGGGSWMKREGANSNWTASYKVAQTVDSNSGTRQNATVIQGSTAGSTAGVSGTSGSASSNPKYYALAYIMRLS